MGIPLQTRVISADHLPAEAIDDLVEGLGKYEVWSRFALHEIRQRFRRSLLGPFWLTASMGVMVGTLGFVFSTLFQQDVNHTLPYIATGIIFWGLLTSSIVEGTSVFIGNESAIRNVPMPVSVHLYQMLTRNLIVWSFNMAIYVIVVVVFRVELGFRSLLFFPAFALFIINVSWMALAAAILSTRFRDIPQIIQSVIQIVFFLTPVFWSLDALPTRPAFVALNPFHHLIELVRAPLLGQWVAAESWLWGLGLAFGGMLLTLRLYRRAYARIAYWV